MILGHIHKMLCCGYKLISFCISFVFSAEDDCVKLEIDRYNIDRICIKDLPIDLGQPAVSIEIIYAQFKGGSCQNDAMIGRT